MLLGSGYAQAPKHRVVWDLSSSDTAIQAAVFRQINNARAQLPDLEIEVVFHGNAIFVLTKDSSLHISKIQKEQARGVTFAICNNSMKRL
jgi:intracellular sulfur oxidation DsrE/DsrF family protein